MREHLRSTSQIRLIREERKRTVFQRGRCDSLPTKVQCSPSSPIHQPSPCTKQSPPNLLLRPANMYNSDLKYPACRNIVNSQPSMLPAKHLSVDATPSRSSVGRTRDTRKAGSRVATSSTTGGSTSSIPGRADVQPFLPIKSNKKKTRRGKKTIQFVQ